MKNTAAFAVFKKQEEVDQALKDLKAQGFTEREIRVHFPDQDGEKDFAAADHVVRVAQGAEWGGGLGCIIGIGAGLAAGAEAFALPFFADIGLPPGVGALVGGLFGAVSGAGSGALVGIGSTAAPPARYARYLEDGGILVSVHVKERIRCQQALRIFECAGGSDVSSADASKVLKQAILRSHISAT